MRITGAVAVSGTRRPCDKSVNGRGSVGILINGQDNIVNDVIIFDFTCSRLGERAANLLLVCTRGTEAALRSPSMGRTMCRTASSIAIWTIRLRDCKPPILLVQGNLFLDTHLELDC